jgi:glycerol kinase
MGTGTFIDVNVGTKAILNSTLAPMVAWEINGEINYLLEGQSNTSGACLEWAKDNLKLFESFEEASQLAREVPDSGGVYFVPAINGMDGIPFQNHYGRGSFMGIEASADRRHFIRAVIEGLGFAAAQILETIKTSIGNVQRVFVDGGVSKSDMVLQIMADITGATICRPKQTEATALGAASMTAIKLGWCKKEDVKNFMEIAKEFNAIPESQKKILPYYRMWLKAVERSKDWLE